MKFSTNTNYHFCFDNMGAVHEQCLSEEDIDRFIESGWSEILQKTVRGESFEDKTAEHIFNCPRCRTIFLSFKKTRGILEKVKAEYQREILEVHSVIRFIPELAENLVRLRGCVHLVFDKVGNALWNLAALTDPEQAKFIPHPVMMGP